MRHRTVLAIMGMAAATSVAVPAEATGLGPAPLPTRTHGTGSGSALFVQNEGQFDPAVRFQAAFGPATIWITNDAVWLSYVEPSRPQSGLAPATPSQIRHPLRRRGVDLMVTVQSMSPRARLVGVHRLRAVFNYFLGRDPSRWRSAVPAFGGVRWVGVTEGVSLAFGALRDGGGPAIRVTGRPDDVTRLRLRIGGATHLRQTKDGRMVAGTALGEVTLPPFLLGGRAMRAAINGSSPTFSVGFSARAGAAPASSAQRPGVPAASGLRYGTFLGAGSDESGYAVAVGREGALYVTGTTLSPRFPTTPGAYDRTYNQGSFGGDAFVSKLDATGGTLVYSTFLGGSDTDSSLAIAVGPGGYAYVAGWTYATDFPTTPDSFSPNFNGGCCDGFVTKLDRTGGSLVFSTYLGGGSVDDIEDMALGTDGRVHVTGETLSNDFPTTAGAFDRTMNGNGNDAYSDGFVTALDADGRALSHSTYLGGTYNDTGYGIGVNADGAEYVAGRTQSHDFPTTPLAFDRTFNGGDADEFAVKLDPAGSELGFGTYLGGSDDESSDVIGLDLSGNVYVAGATSSPDFPVTPGAYDTTINSFIFSDGFATKLDSAGETLVYSSFLGGDDSDIPTDLFVGGDGSLYVEGATFSANFPTTANAYDRTLGGPGDAFVSRFSPGGALLPYSTYLGGNGDVVDTGLGLVHTGPRTFVVTGRTHSADFPTTAGAFDTTFNGQFDVFLAMLRT